MNNLNKLFPIWNDLDNAYDKLHLSLNVSTKVEFLKKLLFDNLNNPLLPTLKLLLKKESDSYTNEESEKYAQLILAFDAINSKITLENLNSFKIESLNSFLGDLIVQNREALREKEFIIDDIQDIFAWNPKVEYLTSMEMFKLYGEVNSFSKIIDHKVKTVMLKENFNNKFFIFGDSVIDDFKLADKNSFAKNIMSSDIVNPLITLAKKVNDTSFNFPIVSKELIKNNKLFRRGVKPLCTLNVDVSKDITAVECWGKILYVV